jgi:hypothetical protein
LENFLPVLPILKVRYENNIENILIF